MTRLPIVGADTSSWGTILNQFLQVGHNASGSLIGVAPFINVKDDAYGAKCDGVTDDTASINAALLATHTAGGGCVYIPAATLISAPLVIYSNTRLILDPSCTITLAPGSNCNMILNAAATAQRSVSDAAITSGLTTLTSATANFTSADVGRTVTIGNTLVANITAVTNSTTVTVSVAAFATVSGASCSIYSRDMNIEIAGGTWNRGNNGNAVSAQVANNTSNLRHIDGLSIHDTQFQYGTLKGYNLNIVDVTNVSIKYITISGPNTVVNTDGVCFDGPCQYVHVDGVYGTNGDDLVSFHTVSIDSLAGNQSDITVENLFPNGIGGSAFKCHADSGTSIGTTVRSLAVRGVHGSISGGGNAVALRDFTAVSSINNMSDILVEDVDTTNTTANSVLVYIYCNNANGTITLKNLVWRSPSGNSSQVVSFLAGSTLGTLIIDGLLIETGTHINGVLIAGTLDMLIVNNVSVPNTAVQCDAIVAEATGAAVKCAMVSNVQTYWPANVQNAVFGNKSSVASTIMLNNIYLKNGGIVFLSKNAPAVNIQCLMNNVALDGAYQLAQLVASPCDFTITNLNVITTNQSALIGLTTAGSNMSVRGRGMINPGNTACFTRDGTQTVQLVHAEMHANLSQLAKNNGDTCYNTNAATTDVGVCISNGSNWKNSYTGGIY